MDQSARFKNSAIRKHSIYLNGRKTSVSLENDFWLALHEIGDDGRTTVAALVGQIDSTRETCNLSSAIRLFVFNRLRREQRKSGASGPGRDISILHG